MNSPFLSLETAPHFLVSELIASSFENRLKAFFGDPLIEVEVDFEVIDDQNIIYTASFQYGGRKEVFGKESKRLVGVPERFLVSQYALLVESIAEDFWREFKKRKGIYLSYELDNKVTQAAKKLPLSVKWLADEPDLGVGIS